MISSVIPSLKYSSSLLALRLANGRTATVALVDTATGWVCDFGGMNRVTCVEVPDRDHGRAIIESDAAMINVRRDRSAS